MRSIGFVLTSETGAIFCSCSKHVASAFDLASAHNTTFPTGNSAQLADFSQNNFTNYISCFQTQSLRAVLLQGEMSSDKGFLYYWLASQPVCPALDRNISMNCCFSTFNCLQRPNILYRMLPDDDIASRRTFFFLSTVMLPFVTKYFPNRKDGNVLTPPIIGPKPNHNPAIRFNCFIFLQAWQYCFIISYVFVWKPLCWYSVAATSKCSLNVIIHAFQHYIYVYSAVCLPNTKFNQSGKKQLAKNDEKINTSIVCDEMKDGIKHDSLY